MTSEHDYRNAVRYLQNLLNGENPHYDRCPVCGQRLDYSE